MTWTPPHTKDTKVNAKVKCVTWKAIQSTFHICCGRVQVIGRLTIFSLPKLELDYVISCRGAAKLTYELFSFRMFSPSLELDESLTIGLFPPAKLADAIHTIMC